MAEEYNKEKEKQQDEDMQGEEWRWRKDSRRMKRRGEKYKGEE